MNILDTIIKEYILKSVTCSLQFAAPSMIVMHNPTQFQYIVVYSII